MTKSHPKSSVPCRRPNASLKPSAWGETLAVPPCDTTTTHPVLRSVEPLCVPPYETDLIGVANSINAGSKFHLVRESRVRLHGARHSTRPVL